MLSCTCLFSFEGTVNPFPGERKSALLVFTVELQPLTEADSTGKMLPAKVFDAAIFSPRRHLKPLSG